MLRPCAHGAAKYGIDAAQWRAHLCGLCLGLRDGHGQSFRAATNTDAILLSVLTEAQLREPVSRTQAGRCALRGMQRASVATPGSPGVMLAATASLLLGAAKIRDHVDDGDTSRLTGRPMTRISNRWAERARAQAALIDLDVKPLIAAINSQYHLEQRAMRARSASVSGAIGVLERQTHADLPWSDGDATSDGTRADVPSRRDRIADLGDGRSGIPTLDELTAPTQLCAAELFAHTAVLARRPENVDALREAGRHFGRIAHLADAVEDYDADLARGRFNPLAATGTAIPEAHDLLRQSNSSLRSSIAAAGLQHVPTVRWMLLDPLRAVVHRLGRGIGAVSTHACGTAHHRDQPGDSPNSPGQQPFWSDRKPDSFEQQLSLPARQSSSRIQQLGFPGQRPVRPDSRPGSPEQQPVGTGPQPGPGQQPWSPDQQPTFPGQQPNFPGQQPVWPTADPDLPVAAPIQPPGLLEGIGLLLGQYCTGYACCADHRRPCSGEHKKAWMKRCECDDCCDCDCCSCCSGCDCCDCDCCGCDCSC
ncbi:DUF5685 family protein [Nocardia arthritidis]|uniref:Regulatory protein n=1 Tax=Nocardia arthritidis TaxID=228602 RepID=A0A6G9YTF8_9NOCA|nr:DUF5685 family protein [Nocardia arthritidis]QIS16615.1 hypothetical protein F5544_44060 [Nocardia arthritidis]